MILYMKVARDKYELPEAVAGTAMEKEASSNETDI